MGRTSQELAYMVFFPDMPMGTLTQGVTGCHRVKTARMVLFDDPMQLTQHRVHLKGSLPCPSLCPDSMPSGFPLVSAWLNPKLLCHPHLPMSLQHSARLASSFWNALYCPPPVSLVSVPTLYKPSLSDPLVLESLGSPWHPLCIASWVQQSHICCVGQP